MGTRGHKRILNFATTVFNYHCITMLLSCFHKGWRIILKQSISPVYSLIRLCGDFLTTSLPKRFFYRKNIPADTPWESDPFSPCFRVCTVQMELLHVTTGPPSLNVTAPAYETPISFCTGRPFTMVVFERDLQYMPARQQLLFLRLTESEAGGSSALKGLVPWAEASAYCL